VVDERRVGRGLAGVCRTKLSGTVKFVRQDQTLSAIKHQLYDPGGTTSVLAVMVMSYHSEHRWNQIGAVYASDICQFRGRILHLFSPFLKPK
jgi:hypothetical protein